MSQKLCPNNIESLQQEEGCWIKHYPKLQQYCRFLAQNSWDGDDIVQETYLKALKYQQQQMSPALLNKIAYHHWVDILRKRKNETIEADISSVKNAVTNQLDEMMNTVDLLVKHFTPKQAVIFMLKEAFQYQLKEIADMLNTTEMAVKASLHRAKKRLEKASEEEEPYSFDAFWNKEEREQLSDIFYEVLKKQDPAFLIQSIPFITSIGDVPIKVASGKLRSFQPFSPTSTLCMAA
ncbi:hypothetical protein BACCIP111895_02396 [Neobacillus rhizosphaerae]|uniref:RNA polymerase sigma factor 70 region 4 type 2 domain-containing protein n=1 Tax=Neobacillus rhizosphaerae TaxID=2880965 RepID=A0ABM9ERK1_9BACI|nr:sigma-70 family RNA polymerase sigma factor [Neobacillus rhizosphaerae]CAH2715212.1 hypothetical protein BACCIP111895_02396 [Neobacillus rhizosphaerae]